MSTKVALKAVKVAIDTRKYDEAVKKAKEVLDTDPGNYFAYARPHFPHLIQPKLTVAVWSS